MTVNRDSHEERSAGPRFRRRLARLVTEVFAPAPMTALVLVVVVLHSTSTPAEALRWGALTVLFVTLVPLAYIIRGVRRRRLTDHHVGLREQRPLPLLVGIASVVALLGLLFALGAPRELFALVAAMAAGLLLSLLVTLAWKISVHTGVVAGVVTIVTILFGPAFLLLCLLVVLVAWARVELGDHTPAQVVAGAALGAAVAALVFTVMR